MLIPPLPEGQARQVQLIKGLNIAPLPELDPLPDSMTLPVLLKVGDDVSTDEIIHVPKLFNPSLDRTGEPFANPATRRGLNDLRWVAHQPLVGHPNCQRRRCF